MQIDGWDVPVNAARHYTISWEMFLRNQTPRKPTRVKTIDEHVYEAEKLAREHKGLPSSWWLRKHGQSALSFAIRRYPSQFSHIPPLPLKHKTVSEHIYDAEQLASEYNGLPTPRWLETNGYSTLYACIRRKPDSFTHVRRQPLHAKTVQEHLEDAERLASEHHGLPGSGWLNKHRFSGLRRCIRLNPNSFAHIPRLSIRRGSNAS